MEPLSIVLGKQSKDVVISGLLMQTEKKFLMLLVLDILDANNFNKSNRIYSKKNLKI
jgi:hypothetical protein